MPVDNDDDTLYCTCQQGISDQMICCDNENCKVDWFHYECVGLTNGAYPKGHVAWFCEECRGNFKHVPNQWNYEKNKTQAISRKEDRQGYARANIDREEMVYCTCRMVEYGTMINCDNRDCKVAWFHYGCVGLSVEDQSCLEIVAWFCEACRGNFKHVPNQWNYEKNTTQQENSRKEETQAKIDHEEPVCCTCRTVESGGIIRCENRDCKVTWFHFACVFLRGKVPSPRGYPGKYRVRWYCEECRPHFKNVPDQWDYEKNAYPSDHPNMRPKRPKKLKTKNRRKFK